MHTAIATLLDARSVVECETWRSLWDELGDGHLDRGEAVALLACLTTQLPDDETLRNLVTSLEERRPAITTRWPGSVNIVGTGGGPQTFNISTAAAFVAAAAGVPVVKSGSRAYTSRFGSIDLLNRLGIRCTVSVEDTEEVLERFGIAFTGPYVYPAQLTGLARRILPTGMRPFGRFLNALGPFLAAVPVSAQVTGVSAHAPLARLRRLTAALNDRRIWLCTNDMGADELFSFATNTIYPNDGTEEIQLSPLDSGTLADLAPAEEAADLITHFLSVLSGDAGEVATRTVCLNAAALALAGERAPDWETALRQAGDAVATGAARELAERVRARAAVSHA